MNEKGSGEEVLLTWKRHMQQLAGQSWPDSALYVLATPIGNLADLSLRAHYVLRCCDVIAAEDTRTTRKLLDAWGIDTALLAAHRHNEQQVAESIVQRLAAGGRVALVSDAGTPAVSDPGARIVRHVQAAGYRVIPIPGPSAVLAALMASGAGSDAEPGFAFAGFMPSRAQARREWLQQWLSLQLPVVIFETPHRLRSALGDLLSISGPERVLTIARELSKRFEEISTMAMAEALPWLDAGPHREQGEFVLVVHAPAKGSAGPDRLDDDQQMVMRALLQTHSVRDSARIGARTMGLPRDFLYSWALTEKS